MNITEHDAAVLELANEYWLQSHRIRRVLAEGVDVSNKVAGIIGVMREARRHRGWSNASTCELIVEELLDAIDAELIYQAEQDITASEVA